MAQILTQEEVDALLQGLSGGEIDTGQEEQHDPTEVAAYDLTSQDRIISGRMPTLERTNEKFARMLRATLSGMMRRVVGVTTLSTELIKFGEFFKTLPVPTSLHLFRIDPMRGSALFIVESRIIYTLVDIIFGGSGKESFKIEGREFTAIENNLVRKVVLAALGDLEKAWQPLIDLKVSYQRSEVNPQFAQIVPPADVVVLTHFEIEVEFASGVVSLCIPYAALEPIREKLQAGFPSEQPDVDKVWAERFREGLMTAFVDVVVELGRSQISGRDVINLTKGDVIPLDLFASDPLKVQVEGIVKYLGYPGICKGNQAVKIGAVTAGKGLVDGTE
jgi:flagellar motor switch protein FliM